MASYGMNQLRNGLKLLLDGDPHTVLDTAFVKPGKGQAFVRLKVRNLLTGRVTERTYKASESVEGADVVDSTMQYLYRDGDGCHFMNPETYDQITADEAAMADAKPWLREQDQCTVTLWNGRPIQVVPPNFVELEITATDPGVRGDTSSGGTKPATLQTGAVVKVPLFIQQGERIRVDTRIGEYVSRAK